MPKISINGLIDEDLGSKLKVVAQEEHRSMMSVVEVALGSYFAKRFLGEEMFGDRRNGHDRVLHVIRNSPGIAKRDLTRATQWAKKGERDEILYDLTRAGKIVVMEPRKLSGQRQTRFYVESFLQTDE